MKKYMLLILMFVLTPYLLKADEDIYEKINANLLQKGQINNYQMGRKYIVAIPPNETANFGWGDSAMEIYVSSEQNANLDLTILGSKKQMKLNGGKVLILNEENGLSKQAAEIREPNMATDKTITIESDVPISVNVINSKSTSTDGYMAIPVELWGKEYLHCSYYDNNESDHLPFAGGFLVLGSEDNTLVQVDIRGRGNKSIATLKNRSESIGDSFTFDIDAGQVYQIEGDGLTRGEFDISGTKISANKPIGVISYHTRTVIPILDQSSRDHLSAMMPPTNTLGKEYASISLERGGSKKGDLFRVVAVEDNTNYTIKWYDFETKELLGETEETLLNAGDFNEHTDALENDGMTKSITGTSIFTADKPILLMQYSYSSAWDDAYYDPFMWPVTPTEQYVSNTIVQAPDNKSFGENYINIIAKQKPNATTYDGLKSIKLDNVSVSNTVPSFTTHQIPGTDLYWARFRIERGAYKLASNGDAFFGAYLYGFKSVDSYGWTAAMAFKPLDIVDTVPPKLNITVDENSASKWNIKVEELTNTPGDGELRQEDSGIWSSPLDLIKDTTGISSYNFKEPSVDFEWTYKAHYDYNVSLEVEDIDKPAVAYFYVIDFAGNIAIDSIQYFPSTIIMQNPEDSDFGKVAVNSTEKKTFTFTNYSEKDIQIESILLKGNESFSLVSDELPSELTINESFSLEIAYTPDNMEPHSVSIEIQTSTDLFSWEIKGEGYSDEETLDFENGAMLDFGTVDYEEVHTEMINLKNSGESIIEITSLAMLMGSRFSVDQSNSGATIQPGESLSIEITYSPNAIDDADRDTLLIETTRSLYKYPIIAKPDDIESVEYTNNDIIKISPNPLQSEATITLNVPNATQLKAKLFGAEGQLVKVLFEGICNKGEKALKLDASALASGSYTLVIEFDNQKFAKQILIAK